MNEFSERLLKITEDMENIEARVVSFRLNNTFGDGIDSEGITLGIQEMVVILDRPRPMREVGKFNLATLIALARIGAQTICSGRWT
jgi:hypothetical protein